MKLRRMYQINKYFTAIYQLDWHGHVCKMGSERLVKKIMDKRRNKTKRKDK